MRNSQSIYFLKLFRHLISPRKREQLPWWLSGKESACKAGNMGSIPGSGRSPGEGDGNPLPYSCLGDSVDRGAHRGPWSKKSQTQLTQQEENRICFSLITKTVTWQKPTQPCKTIILQLKKNFF